MTPPPDEHEEPFDLLAPLDDLPGPAPSLSPEKAAALIQGALAGAFPVAPAPAPVQVPAPTPAPPPVRARVPRSVWVMGAGVAVVGAVVAVGMWRGRREPPRVAPPPPVAETRPVPPPPEPVPPVPVTPEPVPPVAVTPEPVPVPAPRAAAEPEDLLRRANERRAQGQWRAAETLYLRVIQASPGSESAYVALVASGGLRVEHLDDARGGLRQYQQALRLRARGALSEEARHGVARAWRALGDPTQEARALEDFLAAHPDSLRAEGARRRLSALATENK